MKKAALLLGGLLLSAFVAVPAVAEVVRVRVTARVNNVYDPNGLLAGKVAQGQRVTGTYVYNTNTPNTAPFPDVNGDYRPYANEARMRFAVGSLVFESKQPTQGITISIAAHTMGGGHFMMTSTDNKVMADGSTVNYIRMEMRGVGNMTESPALPTVAPNFQHYLPRELTIYTNNYSIGADLETAEIIVPDAIVVTPASGTFAANQHFDAAVILPRNSVVQTAQATSNGSWLPLSYPGGCQLQPQVGTGRPSLLCQAADMVLTTLQPGAPIEWTVTMTNGTVYTETVTWERAP